MTMLRLIAPISARRSLLVMAAAMAMVLGFTPVAWAGGPAAETMIKTVLGESAETIDAKDVIGEDAAKAKFRALLSSHFDIDQIARFTLGKYWRTATAEQKKTYTSLVETTILNKYADKILGFRIESHQILGVTKLDDKDTLVASRIKPAGQPEVAFDWRVRATDKGPKIIDILVEGVSMSVTHRSEFSAIIEKNNGNIQSLISLLEGR